MEIVNISEFLSLHDLYIEIEYLLAYVLQGSCNEYGFWQGKMQVLSQLEIVKGSLRDLFLVSAFQLYWL